MRDCKKKIGIPWRGVNRKQTSTGSTMPCLARPRPFPSSQPMAFIIFAPTFPRFRPGAGAVERESSSSLKQDHKEMDFLFFTPSTINQSIERSFNQSITRSFMIQSLIQSINHSFIHSINHSINWSKLYEFLTILNVRENFRGFRRSFSVPSLFRCSHGSPMMIPRHRRFPIAMLGTAFPGAVPVAHVPLPGLNLLPLILGEVFAAPVLQVALKTAVEYSWTTQFNKPQPAQKGRTRCDMPGVGRTVPCASAGDPATAAAACTADRRTVPSPPVSARPPYGAQPRPPWTPPGNFARQTRAETARRLEVAATEEWHRAPPPPSLVRETRWKREQPRRFYSVCWCSYSSASRRKKRTIHQWKKSRRKFFRIDQNWRRLRRKFEKVKKFFWIDQNWWNLRRKFEKVENSFELIKNDEDQDEKLKKLKILLNW